MGFVVKSEPCLASGCRMAISKQEAVVNVAFCKRCRNDLTNSRLGFTQLLKKSNRIAVLRARVMRQHARLHNLPVMEVSAVMLLVFTCVPFLVSDSVTHCGVRTTCARVETAKRFSNLSNLRLTTEKFKTRSLGVKKGCRKSSPL